ncbi:MAG TPA: hypothetical protein VK507_18110 [Iamia sp.]|nr:hypothetical protein [Iamia sp.]
MIPRPVLVAVGPAIGVATVILSMRGTGAPLGLVVTLAVAAAAGLAFTGQRGGDVALVFGLGAVGVAAGSTLIGDSSVPSMVVWTAAAVAAGEATGLARRSRSVAEPDPAVVTAELTWSAAVVAATLIGGVALLGAGGLPGPDGLVGEVVALAAMVGLAALLAATPAGRTAIRSLATRKDP